MRIKLLLISIQFIALLSVVLFSSSNKFPARDISSARVSSSIGDMTCREAMSELLLSSNTEDNIIFWHAFKEELAVINPKYISNEKFNDLASDPDHNFKQTHTSQLEAISGIYAEEHGILAEGILRGPEGTEFIDGDGIYWDVKTPVSPSISQNWKFDYKKSGKSIKDKLESNNSFGDIHILVDLSYTREVDRESLKKWVKENIETSLQRRISYIVIPDTFL